MLRPVRARARARPGQSICNLLEFHKLLNISFPKADMYMLCPYATIVQAGLELVVTNLVLRQVFP